MGPKISSQPYQNNLAVMDQADYSAQFLDIVDKLWMDLDGKMDMREMLQAVAEFDRNRFYKPWLRAVLCVGCSLLQLLTSEGLCLAT